MTLLEEYDLRTAWKYEPVRGRFLTHPGLKHKVGPDGAFRPFPGSTVVFRPDRDTFHLTRLMQSILRGRLSGAGMCADPLPASTLHMTLHDLMDPERDMAPGMGEDAYARAVDESLGRARDIVRDLREKHAGRQVRLLPDRIVNMVSRSVVLLSRPVSEEDYALLTELYRPFDRVRALDYPLTPHITLMYFRPGEIDGDRLGAALEGMQPDRDRSPVLTVSPEALTAQRFSDMASYRDEPEEICFCCDGGLNRSVMCADILNHMAKERGWSLRAQARAAFPNTRGQPVPEEVRFTLRRHGIEPDLANGSARYLDYRDFAAFSRFAMISRGAADRFAMLDLPGDRCEPLSSLFYGIPDPASGAACEEVYACIRERMDRLFALLADGNGLPGRPGIPDM